MTDEIDEVLTGLHDDKQRVLKAQRKSIEEEITERRLIATDNTLVVKDELQELGVTGHDICR